MNKGNEEIRKRKLEAVAAMLDGTMTESDAAKKLGVSVSDIAEWKTMFAAGMRYSIQSETTPQTRARRSGKKRAAVAVNLLLLLVVGGATAASVEGAFDCDPMDASFFCFQPNSPARASEINHNFMQLSEWVEGAVGPVGASAIDSSTTGTTAINGTVSADHAAFGSADVEGALTATDLTLSGSETVGGQMTVGSDFTADREDADSDNDYDLNVEGDVYVAGTLQLAGQVDGLLTVSDEYTAVYPAPAVEMVDASRSVCFLTRHLTNVPVPIASTAIMGELERCVIAENDGVWLLSMASSGGYGLNSSCSARCISW